MIGKPWLVLINGLGGGVLTVGLCRLLIPRYGMAGAAFAVTIARCVATGMGTFEIWRIHGLHPFSRSFLGKPLLATFLAGVLSYVCKQQFQASATPSFFMLSGDQLRATRLCRHAAAVALLDSKLLSPTLANRRIRRVAGLQEFTK